MNVEEALRSRMSIRQFRDDLVDEATVRAILDAAARAPSGGNVQPWKVYCVAGEARNALVSLIFEKARTTPFGDGAWYEEFPKGMTEPFKSRRRKVGYDLYALAGVAREDMAARGRQAMKNFSFFDAPVGLFFTVDQQFGYAQFVDLGIFLQSIMLMAREHGLHTCPQEAWSMWHQTVSAHLGIPSEERLFCGMALGYADERAAVNDLKTERVPVDEFAQFRGFSTADDKPDAAVHGSRRTKKWQEESPMVRSLALVATLSLCALAPDAGQAADAKRHTFQSQGHERAYYVYEPDHYDRKKPGPLLVALPRGGFPGPNAIEHQRWDEKADKEGFLLVLAEGRGFLRQRDGQTITSHIFNDGSDRYPDDTAPLDSDVIYLGGVLDEVMKRVPYDPRRVYMTGFAMGGSMVYYAATNGLGDRIAAIGPVSSHMWDEAPANSDLPDLITISGADDPINPIKEGVVRITGGSDVEKPSPRTSVQRYARTAGLSLASTLNYLGDGLYRETYGDDQGTDITYYIVQGLGHQWPGSAAVSEGALGPASDRVDATDLLWDHFKTKSRP